MNLSTAVHEPWNVRCLRTSVASMLLIVLAGQVAFGADDRPASALSALKPSESALDAPILVRPNQPAKLVENSGSDRVDKPGLPTMPWTSMSRQDLIRSAQTVLLFGLMSLAPVAVLMFTAFVRINIILILLRQALGSPQVPGNQVLTALALLLTALVMRPTADTVYHDAVAPYLANEISEKAAWAAGTGPIKMFMVREIWKTNHQHYLDAMAEYDTRAPANDRGPATFDETLALPLRVVAPAFLLSELTAALLVGFYLYLPFLVIDLVVAAVLAASGLFMLPPSLIATPLKLLLFVLADGWIRVAHMILSGYGTVATSQ
jgi:flagellar biosynthetic protein FliP